jgi:ketosteroid isomerase-like protein
MQTSREWSRVAATDSIEKTLSYWADDAIVMSPGQPAIKGKNAIFGMIKGTSKIPGFKISWEPVSASVSRSGDMGYLIEQTKISFTDSTGKLITELNKSVTVWKKDANGSWKNIVDIWNADSTPNK